MRSTQASRRMAKDDALHCGRPSRRLDLRSRLLRTRATGVAAFSETGRMTLQGLLFQAIDGLAAASGLFFVAAGLSLIFGVTRIVNIAHGSLYMLGTYVAATIALRFEGALGFWGGVVLTALLIGLFGAVIEIVLLRRIYRAPELFQLLATFALVLIINDAALWIWGPEDLLGPRAPGLRGAIDVLGRRLPTYNVFLIVIGPLVLLILHLAWPRPGSAGWCALPPRIARWSARWA